MSNQAEPAQRWLAEHVPDLDQIIEDQRVTGNFFTPELHRRLGASGWLGAGWPKEYGGTDNDVALAQAIDREMTRRGLQSEAWQTTKMIINTLLHLGTEEQKHSFVSGALKGEITIALGYTEPDSGSDAAAAKTRAERDGDEWVINGQKMFTTNAHLATHVFMLTRTNTEVPKHEGLTMLLVKLDAPGIEVQPVWTLGRHRTNATFYTDVRTPDANRVGDVDGGWRVMSAALVYERGGGVQETHPDESPGHGLAVRVGRYVAGRSKLQGVELEPSVVERIARISIEEELSRLLSLAARWATRKQDMSGAANAGAKMFGAESRQRHAWALLDILGEEGVLERDAGGPLGAAVEEFFRAGVVHTIAGGSSEICRGIVAERGLGLPRSRNRA